MVVQADDGGELEAATLKMLQTTVTTRWNQTVGEVQSSTAEAGPTSGHNLAGDGEEASVVDETAACAAVLFFATTGGGGRAQQRWVNARPLCNFFRRPAGKKE